MLAQIERDPKAFDAITMTFSQLADHHQESSLIDPEYRDDRKICRLAQQVTVDKQFSALRAYFGKRLLRFITHSDLASYKAHWLRTPIVVGPQTPEEAIGNGPTTGATAIYCQRPPRTRSASHAT